MNHTHLVIFIAISLSSNITQGSANELFTPEVSHAQLTELSAQSATKKTLSNNDIEFIEQTTQSSCDVSILYNTNFLRDIPAANSLLKKVGFHDVYFQTEDNLIINALMLDQSSSKEIKGTIIACPGFFPGRKEGMGTLYAMLQDQPYNFVLLDFRGHGDSHGELLTPQAILNYGKSEYYDICAAIKHIHQHNKNYNIHRTIIIHGLCAGAFHSIKALNHLKINNDEAYDAVQGIICDSSWNKLAPVAQTTLAAEINKRCKSVYGATSIAQCIIIGAYQFFVKPTYTQLESIDSLMENLDQKVLFIHAENDTYTPYQYAQKLMNKTPKNNKSLWVIYDEYSHAVNYLKHKNEYKKNLCQFLETVETPHTNKEIQKNNQLIHLQNAAINMKKKLKEAIRHNDIQASQRLKLHIEILMQHINRDSATTK